ncbi:Efflux transport system, outer membrane factor (OMF) lipoprotein [Azospirillum argentinense]
MMQSACRRLARKIAVMLMASGVWLLSGPSAEAQSPVRTRAQEPHGGVTLAPPATPDGPTIALTLPDAVALALRDNRTIKSAYLQRISQKFDLRVAEDKFSPRLTVSGTAIARRANGLGSRSADITPIIDMTTPLGTQIVLAAPTSHVRDGGASTFSSALNLAVIQPLLRDGGIEVNTASVRIARIDEQINRLQLKLTVSRTVSEVILTYREFLRAREQLRIARESFKRSRDLLDVSRSLIRAGRMAEVELVQNEADVAAQEYAVEEAANQLDGARLALLGVLAVSASTDISAMDTLESRAMRIDVEKALVIAFDNQPEHLAQLLAIERSKITLAVARNQRQWDLAAIGGANLGRTRAPLGRARDSGVYGGLQLVVPLGDLSLEQAEVGANVAWREAELRLEALRQRIEKEVRDAVRNAQTRWRQLELARRFRDLARRKIDVENQKLKVGRSSNFQVLSFEADLRNAENALLSAVIAYLNALTILDQQLGTTLDTWQISIND